MITGARQCPVRKRALAQYDTGIASVIKINILNEATAGDAIQKREPKTFPEKFRRLSLRQRQLLPLVGIHVIAIVVLLHTRKAFGWKIGCFGWIVQAGLITPSGYEREVAWKSDKID